jgi:hypothetical protein
MENVYAYLIFLFIVFIVLYLTYKYYNNINYFMNRNVFYQENIDEIKGKMKSLDHSVNSQKTENKSYRYV